MACALVVVGDAARRWWKAWRGEPLPKPTECAYALAPDAPQSCC
jgi:hypothetical protein